MSACYETSQLSTASHYVAYGFFMDTTLAEFVCSMLRSNVVQSSEVGDVSLSHNCLELRFQEELWAPEARNWIHGNYYMFFIFP